VWELLEVRRQIGCAGGGNDLMHELAKAAALLDRASALRAASDSKHRKFSRRWRGEILRAAKLQAKAARIRREALHGWSTQVVRQASDLTVIAPAVQEETRSPRGNEQQWGASVESVSKLNRHVRNQAPGMAIQMLEYKAKEAGIRCDVVKDEAPKIGVGSELVTVGKTLRRAKRKTRKAIP
jgi:hypothetical protein